MKWDWFDNLMSIRIELKSEALSTGHVKQIYAMLQQKNYLHGAQTERWPWSNTALVHYMSLKQNSTKDVFNEHWTISTMYQSYAVISATGKKGQIDANQLRILRKWHWDRIHRNTQYKFSLTSSYCTTTQIPSEQHKWLRILHGTSKEKSERISQWHQQKTHLSMIISPCFWLITAGGGTDHVNFFTLWTIAYECDVTKSTKCAQNSLG